MECRPGCGACCVAISIAAPIPGLPDGKPAGTPCPQLTDDRLCALFGDPRRPAICGEFSATPELCGEYRGEALVRIADLEAATRPD